MKDLYQIRKDLHEIPEPGLQEFKTTSYLLEHLKKLPGLKLHTFSFPGILAEYTHGNGDYLLFRSDMDALPITEKTGCDYSSRHPGFMHACGHDVHMTVLIGLIENVIEEKRKQNILFLFQPAEEGFGGAEKIIATKILDGFKIKEAYALHVNPSYPLGTIATNPAVLFGATQEFDITFKGSSSHAAHPHKGKDSIATACCFYQTLLQSLQKTMSPMDNYLCHIGKITGGAARNIVADECILQGTLRTLSREKMEIIKAKTTETAKTACIIYNTETEIKYLCSYDPVVNSEKLYEKLKQALEPELHFEEAPSTLLGEDFGFFTTRYEGLMFWVGTDSPETDLHSAFFLPPEKVIDIGLKTFISLLDDLV